MGALGSPGALAAAGLTLGAAGFEAVAAAFADAEALEAAADLVADFGLPSGLGFFAAGFAAAFDGVFGAVFDAAALVVFAILSLLHATRSTRPNNHCLRPSCSRLGGTLWRSFRPTQDDLRRIRWPTDPERTDSAVISAAEGRHGSVTQRQARCQFPSCGFDAYMPASEPTEGLQRL